MSENRNTVCGFGQDGRGTVCIDTQRVLDSCRDRDCFENVRVYLSDFGEQTLANATNVRTRSARILGAFVGVDEVPYNCGFFRVTVRYYILGEFEACLGMGRSQTFKGLSAIEKEVILYGGEGNVTTFSSGTDSSYCSPACNRGNNSPVAIVETVEPIVLGTKVVDCGCQCGCNDYIEVPEDYKCCVDGEVVTSSESPRLYVSFGLFSVIRIVRQAQILVQATDYCVPDKECVEATNDEDPCALFRSMPFPINRFRGTGLSDTGNGNNSGKGGKCGCGR